MFLTFLDPPTHFFDDLQYCKSSKIIKSQKHDDVILECPLSHQGQCSSSVCTAKWLHNMGVSTILSFWFNEEMRLKSNLNESKNPWETLVLLLQQQKMMMIHAVFSAKQDCQPPQSFIPINATSCFHAALKSNTKCWDDFSRSIYIFLLLYFHVVLEKKKHTLWSINDGAARNTLGIRRGGFLAGSKKNINLVTFPALHKVSFEPDIQLICSFLQENVWCSCCGGPRLLHHWRTTQYIKNF